MELAEYDKQGYLDKIFRKSKSEKSKNNAKSALNIFNSFCMERFGRSDNEVINEIERGNLDVYKVLDSFVGYMDSVGIVASSMRPYMSWTRGWLVTCDVDISEYKFKQKVSLPTVEVDERKEDGLNHEQIQRILQVLPFDLRLLCMLIMTTLRRPNELLRLRVRDINFDNTPTMIEIAPKLSKNRVGRETFATREVTAMIKDHIKSNHLALDDYLFPWAEAVWRVTTAEHKLRLHLRKHPDLNQKIDGTKRHKITLYTFKDFGFTRAEKVHGTAYAKYLKGDKKNQYSNLPLEEKRTMYLELEPELTIFNADNLRKELQRNYAEQDKRLRNIEKQMYAITALMQVLPEEGFTITGCEKLADGTVRIRFKE